MERNKVKPDMVYAIQSNVAPGASTPTSFPYIVNTTTVDLVDVITFLKTNSLEGMLPNVIRRQKSHIIHLTLGQCLAKLDLISDGNTKHVASLRFCCSVQIRTGDASAKNLSNQPIYQWAILFFISIIVSLTMTIWTQ